MLPTKQQAQELLYQHVADPYQRLHARMVATVLERYAEVFGEDPHLWYMTGYLHDLDFGQHPTEHPGPSLGWFAEWGYPPEMIHAIEAHAYGYNGFTTEPATKLAAALIACDELCGIFYAYGSVNPVPYNEMKVKSIKKRLKEKTFAPKINRDDIYYGIEKLGADVDEHLERVGRFLGGIAEDKT